MKKSRLVLTAAVAVTALGLTACASGFSGGATKQNSGKALSILIASSGAAETAAVKSAVASWSKSSGIKASVQVASDLNQQLAQGFSSGKPADVFYLSTDQLATYAANGSLLAYGDKLKNKSDFYPALVKAFTLNNKLYCAPKDFSTLQLIINTDKWKAAGLTDADIPTTWDQLSTVAQKLTTGGTTGLVMSGEYARMGAFMAQAGGNIVNADNTKATADSAANVTALEYIKKNLQSGSFKLAADVGAGWGGEAFGKQLAAMTVEGNWIAGAMSKDFSAVQYQAVPLPKGPAGAGTLQFTNCWGVAADSGNTQGALDLITTLTSKSDQLAFSKAFGVLPSIQSAASAFRTQYPKLVPFLDGVKYAKTPPTAKGSAQVVSDLNSKLAQLKSQDPATILQQAQANLAPLYK